MRKLLFTSSFVLITLLISCKQDNKIVNEVPKSKNSFEQKLISEPKLFLKYWAGMTTNEFASVNEILVQEGVLISNAGLYYNMGGQNLKIKPFKFTDNFHNSFVINCDGWKKSNNSENIIDGVELSGFDETTYNIFQKKYNLPNFVYRGSAKFILEENPMYYNSQAKENENGKVIKILNQNEAKDIFELHKYNEWNVIGYVPDIEFLAITEDIVIEKENVIILFKVCKDICSKENERVWFYYKNNNKKSPERIVALPDFSMLTVTYLDKKKYYKMKKEMQQLQDNSTKEDEKIKERQKKIESEI